MEIITTTTAAIGAAGWFGNKLLGPTIDFIGNDLKHLYEKGRDRIIYKAIKKTPNIEEKDQTNLRVTRDVFWNGSFTDDEISAEYFGGILAASRTVDGKDDTCIFYADIIKSLSSAQLKMHYIIYRILNKEWIANEKKKDLNVLDSTQLEREELFIPSLDLIKLFNNADFPTILSGINLWYLIADYDFMKHKINDTENMPYLKVFPTTLGIQLFAIANNKLSDSLNYPTEDFGDFDDVVLPQYYAQSLDGLLEKIGLKKGVEDQP